MSADRVPQFGGATKTGAEVHRDAKSNEFYRLSKHGERTYRWYEDKDGLPGRLEEDFGEETADQVFARLKRIAKSLEDMRVDDEHEYLDDAGFDLKEDLLKTVSLYVEKVDAQSTGVGH